MNRHRLYRRCLFLFTFLLGYAMLKTGRMWEIWANCGRSRASGPNIEADLEAIGIHSIADLRGKDPEELYRLDCLHKGYQEDRCQLYVYRLAVYYAETPDPDPDRLRWWLWKDPPDL